MKVSATDMKNAFGKYLKECEKEAIFITKNDRIIAKLSSYRDPSDDYFLVKEGSAAYTYSGKRVTYEEFLRITEGNEDRYEFIDGEVFLLTAPGTKHQIILMNMITDMISWFAGKKCRVFAAPFDVTLETDYMEINDEGEKVESKNVVQPDILVSCDYKEQTNERDRYTGIPALVVEILSPQTRRRDQTKKLNVYITGGVSEYWIVDPKKKTVVQYYFADKEQVDLNKCDHPGIVKSFHFPGLELTTENIFRDVE
ncbi:MAG: Uma2 family endonuclease [Clostridia bacterium]|jgi:Uma2 family endonuclease|nr:Uma2 family endonuclease [Clostridia bacterium]